MLEFLYKFKRPRIDVQSIVIYDKTPNSKEETYKFYLLEKRSDNSVLGVFNLYDKAMEFGKLYNKNDFKISLYKLNCYSNLEKVLYEE